MLDETFEYLESEKVKKESAYSTFSWLKFTHLVMLHLFCFSVYYFNELSTNFLVNFVVKTFDNNKVTLNWFSQEFAYCSSLVVLLILQRKKPSFTYEIIVVDDGSRDATSKVGEIEIVTLLLLFGVQ